MNWKFWSKEKTTTTAQEAGDNFGDVTMSSAVAAPKTTTITMADMYGIHPSLHAAFDEMLVKNTQQRQAGWGKDSYTA